MARQHRYSHHARRALQHASALASEYGHESQDTAHLLVGVLMTEGSLGTQILEIYDLPVAVARVYLKRLLPPQAEPSSPPRTESFSKTLDLAADEAQSLSSHYIGTEHLLLGITRTNLGNAIDLLKLVDITPEQLRRRLRHVIMDGNVEWSLETIRANARLSELARRVLYAAEQHAIKYDHPVVSLSHLLLALHKERRGVTSDILKQGGLDSERLINELVSSKRTIFTSLDPVLKDAINQAEKYGSHYLGADHILLALTLNASGQDLLTHFDVSVDKVRRLIQKQLS
ncbi:MAG: Clp protease N-terminal domain-containing protein [Chloroflexota bacterium]